MTPSERSKAMALKTVMAVQPSVGDYKEFAKLLRQRFNLELKRYKQAALKAAKEYIRSSKNDSLSSDEFDLLVKILIERQYPLSSKLGYELTISDYQKNKAQLMALDAYERPYTFNRIYAENMARARILFSQEKARDISYWFCRKVLRNVNHRMRRNLANAGISAQWLEKRWTVPVIKGQYMSPAVAKGLPDYVANMVSLITKMSERSHLKVQEAIAKGLTKGYNIQELAKSINGLENMDTARAERVARDQSCKLNQFVQRENMKAIGITHGRWVHVPGMFTYRDSHKFILNNQVFELAKGLYDPEVDKNIQPGELPFCRCIFNAVIPDNLLTEQEK